MDIKVWGVGNTILNIRYSETKKKEKENKAFTFLLTNPSD
jgi:hypothetical protein